MDETRRAGRGIPYRLGRFIGTGPGAFMAGVLAILTFGAFAFLFSPVLATLAFLCVALGIAALFHHSAEEIPGIGVFDSPRYLRGRRLLWIGTTLYTIHFFIPISSGSSFVDFLVLSPGAWNLTIAAVFFAPILMTLLARRRWASRVIPLASTGVMMVMAVSSLVVAIGLLLAGGFLLFDGWSLPLFSTFLFQVLLGIVLLAGWRLFGNRRISEIDPGVRYHLGQAIVLVIASPIVESIFTLSLKRGTPDVDLLGVILGAIGWGIMLVGCHLILSGRLRRRTSPSAG